MNSICTNGLVALATAVVVGAGVSSQQQATTVVDKADATKSFAASSQPAVGDLFPVSETLFVDTAKKRVAVGRTSADTSLHVQGNVRITWNGLVNENIGSGSLQMTNFNYDRGWSGDQFGFQPYGGPLQLDRLAKSGVDASNTLYVRPGGFVGIGVPNPVMQLDVKGVVRATDTIVSTKPAGAPFLITSSDLVAKLNADLLDGRHADDFVLRSELDALVGAGNTGGSSGTVSASFGAQNVSTLGSLSIGTANPFARLHLRADDFGLVSGGAAASVLVEALDPLLVLREDSSGPGGGLVFERSAANKSAPIPSSSVVDSWRVERAAGTGLGINYRVAGGKQFDVMRFASNGAVDVPVSLALGSSSPATLTADGINRPGGALSVQAGKGLALSAALDADLSAGQRLDLRGGTIDIEAAGSATIEAAGAATIEAGSALTLRAPVVRIGTATAPLEVGASASTTRIGVPLGNALQVGSDLLAMTFEKGGALFRLGPAVAANQTAGLMLETAKVFAGVQETGSYLRAQADLVETGDSQGLVAIKSSVLMFADAADSALDTLIAAQTKKGTSVYNNSKDAMLKSRTTLTSNWASALSFFVFSSSADKQDVRELADSRSLLKDLRGVRYRRTSTGAEEIGVIAEEVQAVLPELVLTLNDQVVGVDYGRLSAVLLDVVKEQDAELTELRAGLDAALKRIEALERQ